MKLSELHGGTEPRESSEWTLPHPASSSADPPITAAEARAADTAVCRWHNGRIVHSPTPADRYGNVYFCPVGRTYWRYSKQDSGFYAPLDYPTDAVI